MTVLDALIAAAGLALLFLGGELLLRGAVGLARNLGLSPLLIGLTVVAAATSMPELLVTVAAGIEGVPDLAMGNVIGSNIANILLILGVTAVLSPVTTGPGILVRDVGAVLAATALVTGFVFLGPIGAGHGVVMIALLVLYLWLTYHSESRASKARRGPEAESGAAETESAAAPTSLSTALALAFLIGGIAALGGGSELLVTGAVAIARGAGVSEAVIGLTLVAVGTSLPELATAIVAGLRRQTQVALGNALGSNTFNLLLVLGVLALITPVEPAAELLRFDIWVMVGATIVLTPVMLTGWRISRLEGAVFLALYAAYIWSQFAPGVGYTNSP